MTTIPIWKPVKEHCNRVFMQDLTIRSSLFTRWHAQQGDEERLVKADFQEAVKRNSYYVQRIVYQLDKLLSGFHNLPMPQVRTEEPIHYGWHGNESFDLDAFLSASSVLIERPFQSRLAKYLNKTEEEELHSIFPSRQNPESLFWRLNMLRNRAVHIDDETYSSNFELFGEFSSRIGEVTIIAGEVQSAKTTLIDPKSTPEIQPHICSVIEDRSKSLMDEIFGSGRPAGAPKKRQQITQFSNGFDLVANLPDLAGEILKLIEAYHHFCTRWFLGRIEIDSDKMTTWASGVRGDREWSFKECFPEL